jgi:IS30 family transposase
MEGKRSDRTAVSVTVERVTRLTSLAKLANHRADTKSATVVKGLSRQVTKSITADRGPENRKHQLITKRLDVPVYFCNAYHSWEKGTVENTVGRVRRFLPKGMSLDTVSRKQIKLIELTLNNTPRKCLGFLTPCEKLEQLQINNSGALRARM